MHAQMDGVGGLHASSPVWKGSGVGISYLLYDITVMAIA